MNIIFGSQEAATLDEKYIVLEVDTFVIQTGNPITAYCVVENIPFDDFPEIPKLKEQHDDLMENYKLRNWDSCLQSINSLTGAWGGELDTFYSVLSSRIREYKVAEPDDDWNGIIIK
jgi:hypothetical protein